MEEQEQIEPTIELIKPVKTRVVLNGYAKREDNTYLIRWFDNTDKVLTQREFEYVTYDFMQSLNEAAALYQLNSKLIISIKLSTI
jgi:hypothetical protein